MSTWHGVVAEEGGGGRKLGGLKIGQDEAHQQNLFYYSVMQYPIIVNEQFFINHQFRLQY